MQCRYFRKEKRGCPLIVRGEMAAVTQVLHLGNIQAPTATLVTVVEVGTDKGPRNALDRFRCEHERGWKSHFIGWWPPLSKPVHHLAGRSHADFTSIV